MNKLVVTLPTRGRPDKLLTTIKRTALNVASSSTRIMVQVDADDHATISAISNAELPKCVIVNISEREDTVAEKFERALSEPADVYVTMADEHPIITPGFDVKYLEGAEIFPDGLGWVYGECANASFPATMGVTAKFIDKVGFLYPKYFPYWFVDHWIDDLVRIIGRISYIDVGTDQTGGGVTQEMREPAWWATFFDAAYLMRRKQAQDIINSEDFASPDWLKQLLLRHHPMIEYRSRWINDGVRASHHQLAAMNGNLPVFDQRYQRKKTEALALVPHLLNDYGMSIQERQMFALRLLPPQPVPNIPRFGPGVLIDNNVNAQPVAVTQHQQALAPVQGFPGLFAAIPMSAPVPQKEGNPNA